MKGNLPDSEGGTGSMRVLRSRPSEVNPHLFGAAPAMYAHALSSVSLRKTCNPQHKSKYRWSPNHAQNLQEWDLKHDALSAGAGTLFMNINHWEQSSSCVAEKRRDSLTF
jgi:hypothetical protein